MTTCALTLIGAVCAPSISAKDEATDSLVQKYMRSSLYTVILNSETMSQYYEEETKKGENADELEKYAPAKKKGGFGKFAKSMAGMETKGDDNNADFDKYAPAVLNKFFMDNDVAPSLIAKWYDYTSEGEQH